MSVVSKAKFTEMEHILIYVALVIHFYIRIIFLCFYVNKSGSRTLKMKCNFISYNFFGCCHFVNADTYLNYLCCIFIEKKKGYSVSRTDNTIITIHFITICVT